MDDEIVWLHAPHNCWAIVVARGAYYTSVEIPGEGKVLVENDDFDEWSERAVEFESDDEP